MLYVVICSWLYGMYMKYILSNYIHHVPLSDSLCVVVLSLFVALSAVLYLYTFCVSLHASVMMRT